MPEQGGAEVVADRVRRRVPAVRLQPPAAAAFGHGQHLPGGGAGGQLPALAPGGEHMRLQGLPQPGDGPGQGIRGGGAAVDGHHGVAVAAVEAQLPAVPVQLDPVPAGVRRRLQPAPGGGARQLPGQQVGHHLLLEGTGQGPGLPQFAPAADAGHRALGPDPAGIPADPRGHLAFAVPGLPAHHGLDLLAGEQGQRRGQQQQPAVLAPGDAHSGPGEPLDDSAPFDWFLGRSPIDCWPDFLPAWCVFLAFHRRHPPHAP